MRPQDCIVTEGSFGADAKCRRGTQPAPGAEQTHTTRHQARHPVTGRFLAYDCEIDCQQHCARLCGVWED